MTGESVEAAGRKELWHKWKYYRGHSVQVVRNSAAVSWENQWIYDSEAGYVSLTCSGNCKYLAHELETLIFAKETRN
jgi:hypothetical protein